ncbi:MAG: bifunctional phosphoribosylaminoimidazolecarboxamide formyltransferase/IMP cyclohydrolase, partial [Pseudomonadota bacterium]
MFKNALVSVSDKTGLEDFLKPLAEKGLRIVSSGGTAKYLEERGFQVTKVSEQTQFPEVMGGRVKTLHPNIHMPLLQRASVPEDQAILKEYGLEPFDLVVVNLYPFKDALNKNLSQNEMIEFIDIGGPTLLRASAKNFT